MTDAQPASDRSGQPEEFIKRALARGWDLFKQDAVLLILSSLIVAFGSAISLGILAGPLIVGFINVIRKRLRGESAEIGEVFSGFSSFVTSLVVMLLIVIGVVIGSVLLVIPGLLVALITMFAFHYIAYQNAGVGDALGDSFNLVKMNFVNALVLVVVIAILNAVGSVVVIAALITAPLTAVIFTVGFEELSGQS